MTACSVLYSGHSGKTYCLEELFFCPDCPEGPKVLCPNVEDTILDIVSYYCPDTLENTPSADASLMHYQSSKAFACPGCGNHLTVITKSSGLFCFRCSYCRWNSSNPNHCSEKENIEMRKTHSDTLLAGDSWENLVENLVKLKTENKSTRAFKQLAEFYKEKTKEDILKKRNKKEWKVNTARSHFLSHRKSQYTFRKMVSPFSDTPRKGKRRHVKRTWTVSDIDDKRKSTVKGYSKQTIKLPEIFCSSVADIESKVEGIKPTFNLSKIATLRARLQQPSIQPRNTISLLPSRKSLRVKCSRRCRTCVSSGKPGLLVQPELNPQYGDSSFRTNVGEWYKKRSLGWSYLPHIIIHKVHSAPETGVSVKITNPAIYKNSPISGNLSLQFITIQKWIQNEKQIHEKRIVEHISKTATIDSTGGNESKKYEKRNRELHNICSVYNLPNRTAEISLIDECIELSSMEDLPSLRLSDKLEKHSSGRTEENKDGASSDSVSNNDKNDKVATIVQNNSTSVIVKFPIIIPTTSIENSNEDEIIVVSFAVNCECELPEILNDSKRLKYTVPIHLRIPKKYFYKKCS